MKNLSLNNVSLVLTAKERAKLVAQYTISEQLESKDYGHEIETVRAGVTSDQGKEYNFYISLIYSIQFLMEADLQTMTLYFSYFAAQLHSIYRLLRSSIIADVLLLQLKWLPKVMTQDEFEQLYNKIKDEELAAVFSIETLAEHEALASLKSQGELKDWLVDEVHLALNENTFHLKEKWLNEVAQQHEKIERWIQERKLEGQEVKSVDGYYSSKEDLGKPGVTAQSWYACAEKFDTSFNDFIDSKKELVHFHENDVAIDYSPYSESSAEKTKARIKQMVEYFAFVKKEHSEKDYFDITLTLNPSLKEQIEDIFESVIPFYIKMMAYITTTQRIETFYFDDQEIVDRTIWDGTRAQNAYQVIEDSYQEIFGDLKEHFSRLSQSKLTFPYPSLPDKEALQNSIKEQSDELIKTMIERAINDSGFRPANLPS
jgi:hypothetical protein